MYVCLICETSNKNLHSVRSISCYSQYFSFGVAKTEATARFLILSDSSKKQQLIVKNSRRITVAESNIKLLTVTILKVGPPRLFLLKCFRIKYHTFILLLQVKLHPAKQGEWYVIPSDPHTGVYAFFEQEQFLLHFE